MRCLFFNSLLPGVGQIDIDVKSTIVCKTVVGMGDQNFHVKLALFEGCLNFNSLLAGVVQKDIDV